MPCCSGSQKGLAREHSAELKGAARPFTCPSSSTVTKRGNRGARSCPLMLPCMIPARAKVRQRCRWLVQLSRCRGADFSKGALRAGRACEGGGAPQRSLPKGAMRACRPVCTGCFDRSALVWLLRPLLYLPGACAATPAVCHYRVSCGVGLDVVEGAGQWAPALHSRWVGLGGCNFHPEVGLQVIVAK